jgi:hypothetical protein
VTSDLNFRKTMRDAWPEAPERFLDKVVHAKDSECWEWMAALNNMGYSVFVFERKVRLAHRLSYRWAKGDFPDHLYIRHRCDNPKCCNPRHLEPGTQLDNMRDCAERGRGGDKKTNACRGERNYQTHLTEEDVRKIRLDARVLREIAADYNIAIPTVSAIRTRRLWKHVE